MRRSPALLSATRPLPGPALTSIRPTAHCRPHRIYPTACRHPHPSMSPPSRSRAHRPPSRPSCATIRIVPTVRRRRLTRVALRRPHRAHRALTSASPPSPSSRCVGPGALTGKNRTVCIPFSPNARKRPPSWQHPPEMHALRDRNGNILALCIHFRAQSGDSGCMTRESCRQGPFFASRSPKSRMARRCCQRRPAFPRQRHAAWPNGLCALRRGPGLLAACAPLPSRLCPPPPAFIAAVLHAPRFAARIAPTHAAIRRAAHCGRGERRSGSSCRPRAAHADASRYLRAAPIPPAARTHRVQETSGTTQTTQCGHKNRIPKWGPY